MYIYEYRLKDLHGSISQLRFDSCFSNYDQKETRQGCATRLWNPEKHPFRIDPLSWTLNFQSDFVISI